MSDIFSPVMKASSSRITSSVFQITTRSSKLDTSRASTRGEREDDRQTGDTPQTQRQTPHTENNAHRKRMETKQKQKEWLTAKKKENPHTAHTHGDEACSPCVPLYLPPDKYVTGLFPSEVIIVLQYYFVCIPNNHPELISGKGRRKEHIHTVGLPCDSKYGAGYLNRLTIV